MWIPRNVDEDLVAAVEQKVKLINVGEDAESGDDYDDDDGGEEESYDEEGGDEESDIDVWVSEDSDEND